MTKRLTLVAVLVPLLGLLALVGRAEWSVRHGPVWTIPIDGFDPRDLLHGQYLQYQYRLRWRGQNTCGPHQDAWGEPHLVVGCCLCLVRDTPDGYDPFIRQVDCTIGPQECDGILQSKSVMPPLRHFVPEERATALEAALGSHQASIELSIDPKGEPAVRDLLLDRRPWRDVLGR